MNFLILLLIPILFFINLTLLMKLYEFCWDNFDWWKFPLFLTYTICFAFPGFILSFFGPIDLLSLTSK